MEDTDRSEVCFLALTRPAMLWGCPVEAVGINAAVTFFGGMILSGPSVWCSPFMFWLACIPVHLVLQRITAWDFHGFRTLRLWLETTGVGRIELDSLPTLKARSGKDVATCV
jgi:type IV secretory pathway VirB3-like protein